MPRQDGRRHRRHAAAIGLIAGVAGMAQAETSWHWSNPLPQGHGLNAAAASDHQYVAVGQHGTLLGSADGQRWTPRHNPGSSGLADVLWDGSAFIAIGQHGTIVRSTDGYDWRQLPAVTTHDLRALVWSGSRYVAAAGTQALTSTDGIAWQAMPIAPSTGTVFTDVVWTGQQFVLFGGEKGVAAAAISPDGLSWTLHHVHGGPMLTTAIAWNGTHLLAAGNDPFENVQSYLLRSSDGVNWTAAISPLFMVNDIGHRPGHFLLAGGFGGMANTIHTSSDGLAWSSQQIAFEQSLLGAAWTGAAYVLLGEGGYLATSPDASAWQERSHGYRGTLYGVRWLQDEFVATSYNGVLLTSRDGRRFTEHAIGSAVALNDIARAQTANGERWLGVGYDGAIVISSDRVDWTPVASGTTAILDAVAWGNGRFVVVGSQGTLLSSADGVDWAPQSVGLNANFHSVVFDGQQFVITGASTLGAGGSFDGGLIYTSPDGAQWTQRFLEPGIYPAQVCWNGARLVAAAGRRAVVSSDGIEWNVHAIDGLDEFEGVDQLAWDGRRFLAVGSRVAASSTDGQTWQREPTPITLPHGIASDGRQFVVVGHLGAALRTGDDLFANGWE